ncbi:MAG: hypothetical protein QNI89_17170 [Desulfobacterales bacterium]|nr:hypothetical protein [Desulfobacterales bacterium]
MDNIKKTYEPNNDLTTFKVTGKLTGADLYDCVSNFFGGSVTLNTLWDITEAEVPVGSADEISNLAHYVRNLSYARHGGKTAIISHNDLGYGMSRMLGTLYEMEKVPFEIHVFRSIDEATQWLGNGSTPPS